MPALERPFSPSPGKDRYRRRWRLALGPLLLALLASLSAGPASGAEYGIVTGRVSLPPGTDPALVTQVSILVEPLDHVASMTYAPSADGTYRVDILFPSVIRFDGPSGAGLAVEYFGGAHRKSQAKVVQPGPDRSGFDVALDVGGTLSGRISVPDGLAPDSWYLTAKNVDDTSDRPDYYSQQYHTRPDATGAYSFRGLPTGRYLVGTVGDGTEYWKDSVSEDGATLVPVTLGRVTTGIDPVVELTTYMSGLSAPQINDVGTSIPVSVNVSTRTYTPTVTGDVEVVDASGRVRGRGGLVAGGATISVDGLAVGRHELVARFLGNSRFAPSQQTISVWVTEPAPLRIDRLVPSAGAATYGDHQDVTIIGTGFRQGTTAFMDGQSLSTEVVSPTQLRVRIGNRGAAGTGSVTVQREWNSPPTSALPYVWTHAVGHTPTRILDSAHATYACADVRKGTSLPLYITGVWVNVTAVDPDGPGYVVVHPGRDWTRPGAPFPEVSGSTVNFERGRDVANSAYVPVSPHNEVCITTAGAPVQVLVDVTGYTVAGSRITPAPSTRVLDTRPGGVGDVDGPVPPRTLHTVQIAGRGGVPADATSVLLNVTVTGPTAPGNLRVFPGRSPVPATSVVNYAPGQDKANSTTVQLVDGAISFWSDTEAPPGASPVHVLLDVGGWTTPGSPLTTVAPARVVDTRGATGVGPIAGPLRARTGYSFSVTEQGTVPADATAVVLHVTAIGPTAPGNLRVFPDDDGTASAPPPGGSVLNYIAGRDIPNQVVVPLPATGRVALYSDTITGVVDVAVDVVGYVRSP